MKAGVKAARKGTARAKSKGRQKVKASVQERLAAIGVIYQSVIELRRATQRELDERSRIKETPAYQRLDERIRACREAIADCTTKQDALLQGVQDSRPQLEVATGKLFVAMRDSDRRVYREARLKFANRSEVNTARLWNDLNQDIDAFLPFVTISQSTLTKHCKEHAGSDYLLRSINTRVVAVGVEFSA